MLYEQVKFSVDKAEDRDAPVRLDVTMFLGLLAVNDAAVPPVSVQDAWRRQGYLGHHDVAQSAKDLIDRPVLVTSLTQAEALFALDQRVDRPAAIRGGSVSTPIIGLDEPLAVTLDGRLQEISLDGAPTDLAALAAFLDERLDGVSVDTEIDRLVFSRSNTTTAGTLSVLGYPALGFAASMDVRANPVTTAMGAAIRQFFDMGGSRAVIVSLGQPRAVLADADARARDLATLLDVSNDGVVDPTTFSADFKAPHIAAPERSGLTHLFGAEAVGQLVIPDLLDLVSGPREETPDLPDELRPVAGFAACVPPNAALARGQTVDVDKARLDVAGLALWTAAIHRVTTFLAAYRRDVGLIAAI
ncbi:MAG: hypothetical protein AB8B71_12305 [Paracoccaceae bacterium]